MGECSAVLDNSAKCVGGVLWGTKRPDPEFTPEGREPDKEISKSAQSDDVYTASSHSDDDFSLSVSLFHITDGLVDLAWRVRSVDDRCDLPSFNELSQDSHGVFLARRRKVQIRRLTHERRHHDQFEKARQASQPPAARITEMVVPDEDVGPLGAESASAFR